MEDSGLPQYDSIGSAVRKKRSQTSRQPKPDTQVFSESHDHSPLSTTTPSEDVSKGSGDENADANSKRKEFSLNQCMSRFTSPTGAHAGKVRIGNKEGEGCDDPGRSVVNNKRSTEGVLAPANWRSQCVKLSSEGSSDALGNENKVKKVKLKVRGVTHTVQANSMTNGSSSMNNSQSLDRSQERQNLLETLEEELPVTDKRTGLQGVPWKDFSRGGFRLGKEDSLMGKKPGKSSSEKVGDRSEPVRKSKRVPKRRALDLDFDEDAEDDEIRYLEKLKSSKPVAGYKKDDEELGRKERKLSTLDDVGSLRSVKDAKKPRSDRGLEETDYEEEDEPVSEGELDGNNKEKKESVDSLSGGRREMTLTTRQRALHLSKDGSSAPWASVVEFPNGLPPAPSRKQKEKLSEVEMQLKKAEAAQRRRMQVEKAARESEEAAIRKILGQDSNRKRQEGKMKKRQEVLAQEKAANAEMLASNSVRWTFGPNGNVVTFPKDTGLPSIFDSKPCSYPPPREKCAGPSCTNPFKYRDSKSKLPLCSLQCYKAVQEQSPQTESRN